MKQHYKKFAAGGVGVLLWAGALIALAQTPSAGTVNGTAAPTPPTPVGTSEELRERVRTVREEARTESKGAKTKRVGSAFRNARQEAEARVQEFKKQIEARREELKKQLESSREEFKKKVEAAREEAKTRVRAAREEFRKRVEQIKDERKKEIAKRLAEQMNLINERWTTHFFMNVLDRLDDILGKIQIRADKAAALGKDVSAAKSAITAAKAAIASARTAVEAQSKKVYTVTITSDEKLGEAFKSVRDQLHKDLTALRDVIKAARDAVQSAARSLSGIRKVDEEPESESAPAPSGAAPSGGTPTPSQ